MMFDPFSLKLAAEHLRTELAREADAERLAAQLDQPDRPRSAWSRLLAAAASLPRWARAVAARTPLPTGRSAPARSS